jgi:hypothetical protein
MGAAEQLRVTTGELEEQKAVARFAALSGAGAALYSARKLLRVNLLKNQSGCRERELRRFAPGVSTTLHPVRSTARC